MPIFDLKLDISGLKRESKGAVDAFGGIASAAENAQQAVTNIGSSANRTAGPLSTLGKQGKDAGNKISAAMKDAAKSILALVGAYKAVESAMNFAERGVEMNAAWEQSKIGIASVIASVNQLEDAQGNLLKGSEAYQAALGLAEQAMNRIKIMGLETTATTDDLVAGFQQLIGPAAAAGLSMEQTLRFTTSMVQSLGAIGIPFNQLSAEARSLLDGTIVPTQDRLATTLGITGDMVRNWKEQDVLAEKLLEKMSAFAAAGDDVAHAWSGVKSNLQDAVDMVASVSSKGLYEDLKESLLTIQNLLVDTSDTASGVGYDVKNIVEALTFVEDKIGEAILDGVQLIADGLKKLNTAIGTDAYDAINDLSIVAKSAAAAFAGLAVAQRAASSVERWNQYKNEVQEAARADALKAQETLNAARATTQAMREEQAFIKQQIASAEATKKNSSQTRALATLRQELAVVNGSLARAEREVAAAQAASKAAGDKFLSLQNGVSNLAVTGNKLKAAFSSLMSFFGGPWGVALTAATAGVGYLAAQQTEAERVSEKYSEAYAKASKELVAVKDAANTAAEGVNNLTQAQARVKLDSIREDINKLIKEVEEKFSLNSISLFTDFKAFDSKNIAFFEEVTKLIDTVKSGTPDFAGFIAKMDELSSLNPKLAAEFQSYAISLKALQDVQKEQQGIIDRTSTKQKEHTDSVRLAAQTSKELEAAQKALNESGQKEIKTAADAIEWLAKRYNATKQGKEALEAEAKATDESALATLRLASAQALAEAMAAGLIASQEGATQAQIDNAQKLFAEYSKFAGFIAKIEASKGKLGEKISGGGTSSIDNARQSVERLKDEIAQLNGTAGKAGTDLKKKLAEIEKLGKAAKLSAGEIQRLKTDYTDAFRTNTLNEFNKEVLKLEDNTGALREIEIAETVKEWEQRFTAAGLSAEQAAPHMERLKKALAEQEDFKDLKVAADFYKELGELSGEYGKDIEYQNRLIEKQAKAWKQAGIPLADIQKRVELMRLKMSTDPFDGAYRGLLKFNAEFADSGAQWEDITYGFASDFNSVTKDMFDDFLDNGRVSFDDMGQLFRQLLKDMAYQALIQPVVLSVVNGAAGALYGSTTAGRAAAAGTGMDYAGSVIQLGAQAAQGYATNQLMSGLGGSGGMFGGIANSINSGVAGMFPSLFAPTNTLAAAGSAVNAIPGMAGSMPTSTFTGLLGGAGLAGGLGSLGYGLLGGAIGLPQSQYTGITSGIGSALGYMGGSTLGASLGGTIGSVVPVVGTIVGALAGGLLGSVFGGWEDDPPELHYGTTFSLTDFNTASTQSPFGRGSRHDASGYYTFALGAEGLGAEIPNQVEPLLHSTVTSLIDMSRSFADSLGSVSQGMRDDYINALNEQGPVFQHFKLDGDWINDEQIEGHLKQLTKMAGEKIVNALGNVDLQPLSIAADGIAADTVDELGQSLTQAFSFYDIGETFEDEKLKAQFQAQAQKQIVDAFADLDFSFLRVDFDKSSFAGLQQAYAAVQAWDTVTAGLEAILNPLSELTTQLNTATTQFDGWLTNLRALGWQEEAIAEIEQQRAQYLHQYATAVTRAGEQDLALRTLALEYGSGSDAYGIRSLQYKQENELAQLAAKYGKDSGLYSTAVEVQQAELAQTRVDQLEAELEKAVAAEQQAAQSLSSSLSASASSAKSLLSTFENIRDVLEDARRNIWTSGDDNLLGTGYRESMAAFEEAYAKGMTGDQDALSDLPSLANALLASGRDSLSTSGEYNDLFYDVDQKLKEAQAYAAEQVDGQTAIVDSLQAQLDALNAQTAASEYTGRTAEAIRAELEQMRAVLEKEKADITGGGSLSQREALLQAKANQLNAQAHMGRTDWTPDSTLSEIYRNNLTLESWFEKFGRYEGLGVEYDTDAARQSYLGNKANQMNAGQTLAAGQTAGGWTAQSVLDEINRQGMTPDEWFLRYGLGEGISAGGKDYSGNAPAVFYDYDALLRDKAADLSAEGYLGIAHWTARDVAAEIANQGMTVPQWYELYGKQEGYALKAAATTNRTVEKGLDSVSGAMDKQLASSQALGSIMGGVGSTVAGYMSAVQSGMSGLSSSLAGLNLNVTVNVSGDGASASTSTGGGPGGASGGASAVDPFAPLSSATGVFGSHYQTEYALLTAKARRMADDGDYTNLPDGYTSWTAAAVSQAIKDAGLPNTKDWYEKFGKAEGFAGGGLARGLSVIGNELVDFKTSSRVYPAETTFAMAEGGFEFARDAYEGMRDLSRMLYSIPAAPRGDRAELARMREEMAQMRKDNAAMRGLLEKIAGNTRNTSDVLDRASVTGLPVRAVA